MTEKKNDAKAVVAPKPLEAAFGKEQIIEAKRFADRKDILNALLENGKMYTIAEASRLMDEYMKGRVM